MCLIVFALGTSPRWPLVIAANRDEFWRRATAPLATWNTPAGHTVASGRDLEAGGTWMGATPDGRVAFLTNVREPSTVDNTRQLPSRGELVLRWLDSKPGQTADFVRALTALPTSRADDHAGFNLVVGNATAGDWHWVSNRVSTASGLAAHWVTRRLTPGVYGLSNAALDTDWPKTRQLKSDLASALARCQDDASLRDTLWRALGSSDRFPAAQLPATGVGPAAESALSSVKVDFPENSYGTRSSAVWLATALAADNGSVADRPGAPGPAWTASLHERSFSNPAPDPDAPDAPNAPDGPFSARTVVMRWPRPGV